MQQIETCACTRAATQREARGGPCLPAGCIGWDDFERFMKDEFSMGKQLLSGEYVLPSGARAGGGVGKTLATPSRQETVSTTAAAQVAQRACWFQLPPPPPPPQRGCHVDWTDRSGCVLLQASPCPLVS